MSLAPANSELTGVAWVLSLPGFHHGMCATQLPKDQASWAADGFVVVGPDASGAQNPYIPWGESVLQLDIRAVNPNNLRPDWGKAASLGQRIINAAVEGLSLNTVLHLRPGYHGARVTGATPNSTLRRIPTDPSSYALYRLDLGLHWIQVSLPEEGDES